MNGIQLKCSGTITRSRITSKVKEESVIDFVIVCEEMEAMVSDVVIDESRKHVLTKHTKTKNRFKVKESDHNSIITNIKAIWNKKNFIKKICKVFC